LTTLTEDYFMSVSSCGVPKSESVPPACAITFSQSSVVNLMLIEMNKLSHRSDRGVSYLVTENN
tara:strand:+ start:79 stop:270 length:192 start_codon:yes stop_codon:yes gene_type:complete